MLLSTPIAILAIVALFTANARADLRRGLLVCGGMLAGAAGLFLLATIVTTRHEEVRDATRRLVRAVATADRIEVDPLLATDIEIRYPGFASPDRATLLDIIQRQMGPGGPYHLSSHRIAEVQATLDGSALARSQVLVRATHAASAVPASAWVLMKWERGSDDRWRCFAVEPIEAR